MEEVKVYNTASRKLEVFVPGREGEVRMYVCGPTVYDDCHLGHARAMVAFDIVRRWLAYRGYRVRYVRNITDVDDKIIKRAAEKGVSCESLTQTYIDRFHEDMDRLALVKPDIEPRATRHIREMVELVSLLCEKGLGYVVDGDVYFDVEGFFGYGKLSGRKPDDLLAGARVEVDGRKKNPLDFALWKSAKPGEPEWPSPWGPGRPGWHIECSAMSSKYLGEDFDIHGGGQDLIFPHHENEIAQFEGATGKPFARYWLHNAHVTVNETKMSKSLGNFFTLREIYERFSPGTVRFFLVRSHYRTPIDFSDAALEEAEASLARIEKCLARVEEALARETAAASECPGEFALAMDEDFNTAAALGCVFSLISRINAELDSRGDGWRERVEAGAGAVRFCCGLLGLDVSVRVGTHLRAGEGEIDISVVDDYLSRGALEKNEMEDLVRMRSSLREKKMFDLADRIRRKIQELGHDVRDDREGAMLIKVGRTELKGKKEPQINADEGR